EGFRGNDRGGEPALHVAGAAAEDLAVLELAAEGIGGPARADFDHVAMRVEMHCLAWKAALTAGDEVPARIPVAVARRALRPDHPGQEPAPREPAAQELADFEIGLARGVEGGDADEVLRQGH